MNSLPHVGALRKWPWLTQEASKVGRERGKSDPAPVKRREGRAAGPAPDRRLGYTLDVPAFPSIPQGNETKGI